MQKSDWERQMDHLLLDITSINEALESNRKMIQVKAMSKIVELGLYDDHTIFTLRQMSKRLEINRDQIIGLYMLGHFSMATLYEIYSKSDPSTYKSIYDILIVVIKTKLTF